MIVRKGLYDMLERGFHVAMEDSLNNKYALDDSAPKIEQLIVWMYDSWHPGITLRKVEGLVYRYCIHD